MKVLMSWFGNILRHPSARSLSFAIPLSFGFVLIMRWLGYEPNFLIGFLTSVVAYRIAYWIFLTPVARKQLFVSGVALFKDNVVLLVKISVFVAVSAFFFGLNETSSDPTVAQIQHLVKVFGLFVVFTFPVIFFIANGGAITSLFLMTVRGLAAYSFVLWLIGQYGVVVKSWIISHPNESAIYIVSFLFVWFISRFSTRSGSYNHQSFSGHYASATLADARTFPKPTERDSKYIAAHEAGHALVYAALGCLPPGFELVIKDRAGLDGTLGFTSSFSTGHLLNGKSFSEWRMLVLLAGQVGESFAYGENTLGSLNDHQKWLDSAHIYLSNHINGIYYPDPKIRFEQESNEAKLDNLQRKQRVLLESYFSLNADVFDNLHRTLLEKRSLRNEEISKFLRQVRFPDDFPLPFGAFDDFKSVCPKGYCFGD